MPGLKIPSFPVPGRERRDAEEDQAIPAVDVEEEAEQGDADLDGEGHASGAASEQEPPELLELIDAAEEAKEDPAAFAAVLYNVARRLRRSPGDRELLSDFDGLTQICGALAALEWRGEAMLAFCRSLPEVCRTSAINRGALRDNGAVEAVVEFLRAALAEGSEADTIAASVAITALCTANDGNKKEAAKLKGEFNNDELVESIAKTGVDYSTPLFKAPDSSGAMDLLLEALARFPESVAAQTQGISALRTLLCDDDPRQASCAPSAVENRTLATTDQQFPGYRRAIERAFALKAEGRAQLKLREQAMALLREFCCRQDRIHTLVFEAKLLPHIEASLKDGDVSMVRASLAVIRAFAFSDELKEQLAVETDVALKCVGAVQRHLKNPAICEQGFGLFANLTMRKPHIAERINGLEFRVCAVGQLVLTHHAKRPNVLRSVIQTLRNVATQDENAALEVKESDLFENLEKMVTDHENDADFKWRSPVEIAKQFLREFRADASIRKKATYNDYY